MKFLKNLGILLCLQIANTSFSQSYNLHWGSTSWVGPTYSKTISNIGGSGINATIVITNSSPAGNVSASGAASNDAFQYNAPAVGAVNNNWFLPGSTGSNALVEYVDWNTLTSTVATVITFSKAVTGVSFYVGDMDRTNPISYVDRFTFTAKNGSVALPNPIITKFQATVSGPDTVLINGNTAYGNAALSGGNAATSSITTQGATVYVQFNNPVTELDIVWDQGPGATGNPAPQAVAIGDVAFNKIISNYPPTAANFLNKPIVQGSTATTIPGLVASDLDGTISNFKITSIPTASQGVLSIPCPATPAGATCTGGFADLTSAVLAANPGGIVLTPAQAAAMKFKPAITFSGNATFTFNATDNDGNISNTATYTLPVVSLPPVSINILQGSMLNSNGPTAISPFSSSDVDGTISSYQITSLQPSTQGTLSIPCPPTVTGATCAGGFQNLTATILSNYPNGIPLTPAQITGMRFAPAAGFTGTVSFNYNAVDNSGNISNTASYTIPVVPSLPSGKPPLSDNVVSQNINSNLGNTAIPKLQAADIDGSISSYTISTIPASTQGVLRLSCPSTPTGLNCAGGYADILPNTVLTPSEATRLYFDPAPNFLGNVSFTYVATDNSNLVSNIANYSIPVVNKPPVSLNVNTTVPFNTSATVITSLSGSDADGSIINYTIKTVPTSTEGTLSVPCPPAITGGTCSGGYVNLTPAVLTANPAGIILTPAQAAGIKFTPATGYSGTTTFNYTSTDNSGNSSPQAVYNITIDKQPPVSLDITNPAIVNTNGSTSINSLIATDADGTVTGYTILSVPDVTQGVLSIPCPVTPAGATCTGGFTSLSLAVLIANPNGIAITPTQAVSLKFDPAAGYTGLAAFKYSAVDNSGLTSNIATYTIPVTGTGNVPPVAKNVTIPSIPNTNGATNISTLIATDADGSIASYTLYSVPSATQGVLSIPCPSTPAGSTCTGGFADLTPAVLAANPNGISLTPAQAAGMRLDPTPNFSGNIDFSYTATDNSGATSAGVIYTIPVTSLPPIANAVIASEVSSGSGVASIPGLLASDPDGTIATYFLETLPPVSQGVLRVPCPITLTGATCIGGFQDLTSPVFANYQNGGIPLTPTQMAGMRFTPNANYQGNIVFNYHAVDNSSLLSNSTTYTIPVFNLSPLSNDILSPLILNTSGATTIPSLMSSDPDGIINNYVITSLPLATQGVLSIPCPATPAGATCSGGFSNLTSAVLAANPGGISITPSQISGLRFDPDPSFIGDATFNYSAYDNNGNISNVATYVIPTDASQTLPLSKLDFKGKYDKTIAKLIWLTENEQNLKSFEVERSFTGTSYIKIGNVQSKGNRSSNNNYNFNDSSVSGSIIYYRLKLINSNLIDTKYSNVIALHINRSVYSISPNPFVNSVTINLNLENNAPLFISITDMMGRKVKTITYQAKAGENKIIINDLGALLKGTYRLEINSSGENIEHQIIIKI